MTALSDGRGIALSASVPDAVAAAELALWRMMSFEDTPIADLDRAIALDPTWPLPHAMKAGFLLGLTEPALEPDAVAPLAAAARLAAERGTQRERAHVAAVTALRDGDWQGAADRWAAISAELPRDALALHWGHLFDFHRGDATSLAGRIERALPAWHADDPWRPYVQAMHAFGLEEQGRCAEAEREARAALDAEPCVPWAIHAVAHVMETQGRHAEGRAWMAEQRGIWGEGNGFAAHLGWHEALFALEALDVDAAIATFDRYLAPAALVITLQRLDAASLLWRLMLVGVDVRDRCRALLVGWDLDPGHAGRSTFNDLHAVLALCGAGDADRARGWALAAARQAAAGGTWNREVMERVGGALLDAVVAFADGRFEAASHSFAAIPDDRLASIGGSHAQRDVVVQTRLAAAARDPASGDPGRSLAAQRHARKPTPLAGAWCARFEGPPWPSAGTGSTSHDPRESEVRGREQGQ